MISERIARNRPHDPAVGVHVQGHRPAHAGDDRHLVQIAPEVVIQAVASADAGVAVVKADDRPALQDPQQELAPTAESHRVLGVDAADADDEVGSSDLGIDDHRRSK